MSRRDWINVVLVFLDIKSLVGGIQQYATKEVSKIFGLIEMGTYEWIAISLFATAFLLIYNKEWTGKYLDELTGKAREERELRERLELDNRNRMEKQKKEAEEAQAKIEEENKKKQELEEKERKEKEKLDELLSLIRESIKFLVLKVENRDAVSRLSTLTHYNQINLKIELRLIELGFLVPNEEEKAHKDFDAAWYAFLSTLEVVIQEGDYRMYLNFWEQAGKLLKLSKNS